MRKGQRVHAYLIKNKQFVQFWPMGDDREDQWETPVGYHWCHLPNHWICFDNIQNANVGGGFCQIDLANEISFFNLKIMIHVLLSLHCFHFIYMWQLKNIYKIIYLVHTLVLVNGKLLSSWICQSNTIFNISILCFIGNGREYERRSNFSTKTISLHC